jgi:glycosyltransferase involved in cell wall biosynthesis
MSVYKNDNPEYLRLALQSIANQTLRNFELIIVKDGPLSPGLTHVLASFENELRPIFVELSVQCGLNHALNEGIKKCKNELIVRCDADDINLPERFAKQIGFLHRNKNVAVVGSPVIEFEQIGDAIRPISVRVVPAGDDAIRKYLKFRSPFNHPSVAYRKSAVISAGMYSRANKTKLEDYGLWLRILGRGFQGENLVEPLVLFRAGHNMIARRVGLSYFFDELNFIEEKVRSGIVNYPEAVCISVPRALLRFLSPRLMNFFYRSFLRKEVGDIYINDEALVGLGLRVERQNF